MRVDREAFLQQLQLIQPGLAPREIIEQSQCVVFQSGYAYTYNDEVACCIESVLGDEVEGAVTAKPLIDILGKLPEDEVTIDFEETKMVVRGKRKRTTIELKSEIQLPIDKIEEPEEWNDLPESFSDAVNLVESCASDDAARFVLTCVHLCPQWIEAFDNYKLARHQLDLPVSQSVLIKRDSLRHIISLGMQEMAETDNWVHFSGPSGLFYSCRRHLDEYHDLSKVFKVSGGVRTALPKGLLQASERAEVFSSDNADRNEVKVELQGGKIRITGESAIGSHQEIQDIAYKGEPLGFYISPKLLRDICDRYEDCLISDKRLKVDGGNFTFITCLGEVD